MRQLRQGDNTISEYFTKLRIIWDELENSRLDPICKCKGFCKVSDTIVQRKIEDHAMQFFRGLNDQYGNIKLHVLLMDLIPSILKIWSYVLQQGTQLMGSNVVLNNLDTRNVAIVNATINTNTSTYNFCGKPGHIESTCYKKNGFPNNKGGKHTCFVTSDKNNNIWHKRLGHLSDRRLDILRSQYNYIDSRKEHCDVCHMSQQKKLPFSNIEYCANKYFDIIHVDIWGPSRTPSLHGNRYFLTIIDDSSRFTWVDLMRNKSKTRTHLIHFVNYVENQFETKIKIIRSDNGQEFKMNDFFNSKGIVHQTSCVETPEQNGIDERKHQHSLNVTGALIFQSNISTCFWSYALVHVAFLINVTPTPFLKNCTPHEKLYNNSYNFRNLKFFGCLCYMQTISAKRSKVEPRARSGIFFGFSPHTKGYVVFDLKSHAIKVSCNVLFYEDVFPNCYNINDTITDSNIFLPINEPCNSSFDCDDHIENFEYYEQPDNNISTEQATCPEIPQRNSTRTKSIPTYLKDYHTDLACIKTTKYPIQSYISLSRLSTRFQQVTISIDNNHEPKTYKEVVQDIN